MRRRPRQNRTRAATRSGAAPLPLWKKLLFSGLTCVLILGALEGTLALLGVRPQLYQQDPYVGFARNVPHFVPDPKAVEPGTLVTAESKRRILNPQRFTARKPRGVYRIFCLGGSTTYGHPYTDSTSFCGWLREMLPKVDPSRRWELINAGGISYASYREALLMEELVGYEPDLFIVLSAHNEFLEQRTYSQIIAMPEALRGLGATLSRTRIYTALKAGIDRVTAPAAPTGAPVNRLAENPEAILDRTVGPQSYHRDERQRQQIVDHYRFNLARMADIARSVGAGVLFITPASNLRDCAPFKSEHRAGFKMEDQARWQSLLRGATEARRAGRLEEARERLDQAAALDDRRADLHYVRGHVLLELNRPAEARTEFLRARDEDVCPLRALGSMIDATAAVAGERRVPLVDFAKLLEDRSPHGLPGEDWFLDHVHPTIEGHRQLALEIIRVMEMAGLVTVSGAWTEAVQQEVRRTVEGRVTARDQAAALVTLAKVIGWAGKNDEAYRVARRAEELASDDPAVLFEVGKGAARIGRRSEAIRALGRAVELNPRFVEARSLLSVQLMDAGRGDEALRQAREAATLRADDPQVLLNLGALLEQAGQVAEAETTYRRVTKVAPNYAEAYNNLGWVLKDRGAHDEALAAFREAVRQRPGSPLPTLGLAWMLAAHPDPARRNPDEAVRLAETVAAQVGPQDWISLDTLAVARAAAGRFPAAIVAAEQALALLNAARRSEATNVAARLDLYRQGRPFVEPAR